MSTLQQTRFRGIRKRGRVVSASFFRLRYLTSSARYKEMVSRWYSDVKIQAVMHCGLEEMGTQVL